MYFFFIYGAPRSSRLVELQFGSHLFASNQTLGTLAISILVKFLHEELLLPGVLFFFLSINIGQSENVQHTCDTFIY